MASTGSNSSVPLADAGAAHADIVIGLASYNDARTIGQVARSVEAALSRGFGANGARIVLADSGSADGTRDSVRGAVPGRVLLEVECAAATFSEVPYHGHPGRASALKAILDAADRLGASACAFIDPRTEPASPDAVERLLGPVLRDGADYVVPYYVRRAHEGAITRGIVYPMVRALYGLSPRQPAANEFGCSARLMSHFRGQDFWDAERADVGIDLWLAVEAICNGFQIREAAFGVKRTAAPEPAVDVSTALAQIVGALFADLEHRVEIWQRTRRAGSVPMIGDVPELPPEPARVDIEALAESFRLGYRELRDIWTFVLPPRTIIELRRMAETPVERFRFEDRLWATILYDFAIGYSLRVMPQGHLLRSLTPLYSGWLASFVAQLPAAPLEEIERRVERVCLGFEAEKRHLIARWRWPERLR